MVSGLLSAIVEFFQAVENKEPSENTEWQVHLEGWLCDGNQCGGLEALVKSQAVHETVLRAWQN